MLKKQTVNFKIFPKIYYSLKLYKKIFQHMYIVNKCNDNFKFLISLKSYEE